MNIQFYHHLKIYDKNGTILHIPLSTSVVLLRHHTIIIMKTLIQSNWKNHKLSITNKFFDAIAPNNEN